ncbi:MAG: EAL and HDOD domain-containing protein [Sulfurihydrogenibium sp.]|uniref:EAL and HDOD domain-containing protein n=1 Tax=Sulfurihydrogenibium sp. TaxID=2053621 RepID=UPI003C7E585C
MLLCKAPIFDKNKSLYGYEIKYEKEDLDLNEIVKNLYSIISQLDIKKFLDNKQAFIKVIPDIIVFTDFLNLINKEVFIIEIESKHLKSKSLLEKIRDLKNEGFTFSIEFAEGDFDIEPFLPMSSIFNYLSISFKTFIPEKDQFIEKVRELPFTLKAEDLDTKEDFDKATLLGFDLFEGEFFTKPESIDTKEDTFNKLEVLKLIRYVSVEDDLNDIAEAIKSSPDISVRLLKYINSSFFYLNNPITSINRAVAYLGKKNLVSWLFMLSMMSASKNDLDKEAVKTALFRAKFMELLSLKINPDSNIADTAFLVGLLSLAERIFKIDLKTILKELNLSEEMEKVLTEKEGYFGELLNFVIAIEKDDVLTIKVFKKKYMLADEEISEITVETYRWIDTMFEILR